MIVKLENPKKAEKLFAGWQEGCIWSALHGIMGDIYVDDEASPASGAVVLGDFAFLAGKPDRDILRWDILCGAKDFMIFVPQNDAWNGIIEEYYGNKAKKVVRYAIKKERNIFDRAHLEKVVSGLSGEYRASLIDEKLFHQCMTLDWCWDGEANYSDYELYRRFGLGVVILKGGEIVASCSSYCGFNDGIEIQIDTKAEYRRQGLGYVCAAKLILECLDRNWLPSWDAQNLMSVGLAKKLGYHFDREYTAYEIKRHTLPA